MVVRRGFLFPLPLVVSWTVRRRRLSPHAQSFRSQAWPAWAERSRSKHPSTGTGEEFFLRGPVKFFQKQHGHVWLVLGFHLGARRSCQERKERTGMNRNTDQRVDREVLRLMNVLMWAEPPPARAETNACYPGIRALKGSYWSKASWTTLR